MNTMSKFTRSLAPVVGGLLLLTAAANAPAIPQSAITQRGCSLATLKGTYIYDFHGYTLVDGKRVPFSYAGFDYYNGDGTMTGIISGTDDSSIIENLEYTGTYTVNADCTSELTTNDPTFGALHFDLFLDPDGDKYTFVETDKGFVTGGFEQRVSTEILRNSKKPHDR